MCLSEACGVCVGVMCSIRAWLTPTAPHRWVTRARQNTSLPTVLASSLAPLDSRNSTRVAHPDCAAMCSGRSCSWSSTPCTCSAGQKSQAHSPSPFVQ